MTRSERELLADAREHFGMIADYARHDLTDSLVVDAICMRLSAGIEALRGIDEVRLKDHFPDWDDM